MAALSSIPTCSQTVRPSCRSVGAAAGQLLDRQLRRGEAIRIFTGAPMPEGADTMIMQEDCVAVEGSMASKSGSDRGPGRPLTTVVPAKMSLQAPSRYVPGGVCCPPILVLPRRSATTGYRSSGACGIAVDGQ
jgi:MoeA N-terminal region (domain I and II)